jgi:UDP-N-acetylmuramyl pentapeptide phosphotransferase/UDP-N-acetylglucosamine-1-phosphate transferase
VPASWFAANFGDELLPYLGGLRERAGQALVILAGAAVLHVLGLVDDRRPLGAWPKLIVIIAVALLTAGLGGVRIGEMWGTAVSLTLTVAWFIVIINAFNFLDNMDGLSAGVAGVCLAFFAICGLMAGQVFVPALACVCLGASGGFLVFNFPHLHGRRRQPGGRLPAGRRVRDDHVLRKRRGRAAVRAGHATGNPGHPAIRLRDGGRHPYRRGAQPAQG